MLGQTYIKSFLLLIITIVFHACASSPSIKSSEDRTPEPNANLSKPETKSPEPQFENPYRACLSITRKVNDGHPSVVENRDYAFAIYNNENRLITHPVEEWYHHSMEAECLGDRYTDLFVISHGWNYTPLEALVLYNKYIQAFEKSHPKLDFKPYFIFVIWPSISRPLTEATASILPYKMDEHVEFITKRIDAVAFHLPSGWKESIDAYHNALGKSFHEYDHHRDYNTATYETEFTQGRDLPLSAVLFELFSRNEACTKGLKDRQRIHAIGHSYGAKLISLGIIEGLHRFSEKYNGHSTCRDKNDTEDENGPTDSLILFNPAFHPSELYSSFPMPQFFTNRDKIVNYLKSVKSKAIIYSNTDYATGYLYGVSQIVFNMQIGQNISYMLNALFYESKDDPKLNSNSPLSVLYKAFGPLVWLANGIWDLALTFAISPAYWSILTVYNLPQQYWHHINRDDEWYMHPVNAVEFFLPVRSFWDKDEDKQGILRNTFTALGRSGLHNIQKGRSTNELGVLAEFAFEIDDDGDPIIDCPKKESVVSSKVFEKLACFPDYWNPKVPLMKNPKPSQTPEPTVDSEASKKLTCTSGHQKPKEQSKENTKLSFRDGELFYSIDASTIYDTVWHPAGSHGDLRKLKIAEGCKKYSENEENNIRKIDATINFLVNFTMLNIKKPSEPNNTNSSN